MKICGIICEYNPFHNGHAYQIKKARELCCRPSIIVCLMSGHFVQRGDAALFHKALRAKAAILGGADLVLELPTPYSLSSAEAFAYFGVDILNKIGCTQLSFGAESENIDDLKEIAALLLEKSTIDATLSNMSDGSSYAAARERAVFEKIQERSAALKTPNNILAIEYLKAILRLDTKIEPLAVKRYGAGHDSCKIDGQTASATHIRQCISSIGTSAVSQLMPEGAYELFKTAPQHRISNNENLILSQLIRLSPQDLRQLSDVSEGLEYRLSDAIKSSFSFDEICEKAKSRRYPHSRIRRILINGFLGIKKSDVPPHSPYVKVLAFSDAGRELLSLNRNNQSISVITKPALINSLPDSAKNLMRIEETAGRLYHMLGNGGFINEFSSPQYIRRTE